jgi:hypothetical protein
VRDGVAAARNRAAAGLRHKSNGGISTCWRDGYGYGISFRMQTFRLLRTSLTTVGAFLPGPWPAPARGAAYRHRYPFQNTAHAAHLPHQHELAGDPSRTYRHCKPPQAQAAYLSRHARTQERRRKPAEKPGGERQGAWFGQSFRRAYTYRAPLRAISPTHIASPVKYSLRFTAINYLAPSDRQNGVDTRRAGV